MLYSNVGLNAIQSLDKDRLKNLNKFFPYTKS